MAIQSGDNPRIVEHKLSVFLAPKFRPSDDRKDAPAERLEPVAPPPVDAAFVDEVKGFAVAQEARVINAVREAVSRSDAEPDEKARVEELLEQVASRVLPAMTMMARLSSELRTDVSDALAQRKPRLVEPTTGETFAFEDLARLSEREIQLLLREIDQRDLVMALKGSSEELRDKVLDNMSDRVRTFLAVELSFLGEVQAGEVFAVQSRIVAQVLSLARQGQVSLPGN